MASELSQKIQGVQGQVDMVGVLIKYLKLPDPTKRKGLRQFIVNFSSNNQKINDCFDAHRQPPHTDWDVLRVIVNLWAKLGVDSVIRNKLFANGMLDRMIPLLKEGGKQIRTSVLFALSNFTHHGGIEARETIAKLTTPTLVDIIADPECPARSAELSVAVLSHALGNTISDFSSDHHLGEKIVLPEILQNVNAERMCYGIGAIIRRPDVDAEAVAHSVQLLRDLAFYFREAILATHVERAFIAGLASKDIRVRVESFAGILRLGLSVAQPDGRHLDPMRVAAIVRNPEEYLTPELMQALRSQYGGLKGGMIYELAESSTALDAATARWERSRDMAAFGRELCQRILTSEYSVGSGVMATSTGHMESMDTFFERAAKALDQSTNPADAHLPYVLRTKLAITAGDRHRIIALSAAAQRLFPEFAFFYYAQSIWTEDSRVALRLAKKGLACADLTDYVKRGLLYRCAECGLDMTMSGPFILAAPGSPVWSEGVAILHCAQEDSKAYIEMTSMDQKNLKTTIYTYLCITFMLEGDAVFKNLDMVRPYLEKLSLAEQIFSVVCRPLPYTQRKLAVDLIIPQFAKPLKQWRAAIARLGNQSSHHHHQQLPPDDPDHVLANWLARTALDDENTPASEYAELQAKDSESPLPGTSAKDVLVYRCSLCGNPSASLKRCGRCKQARYCDDSCQRKHWKKGHKTACQPA